MIKYALINEENKVIDLLEVNDRDTLDGYVLPEGQCALVPTQNWVNEAQIGLYFDFLTNTFQSEPIGE